MTNSASGFSIEKLQALDEGEWARLQDEFFQRIYFYCKKQVREHQAAEDLTQDVFLGAVRGIRNFDPQFSLEQFLFGIARNRVIDHFRKKRPLPMSGGHDDAMERSYIGIERMASERRSPDQSAVALESANVRREALAKALKMLVEEYWQKGDFEKLKVVEFLFALGGRNKEAAERFDVQDEKAVAGIKYRAIERLRGIARQFDPTHDLFEGLWKPGAR
ncbi:MAG: hypothetical protein CSA62_06270 [Planctomycetota bacterium]|nr:MAG: hypothetical protein CSA62_06270 [Planctomycetota bacterium]